MPVSVCICAYNEQENIGKLLQSLVNQKTSQVRIEEIVVVSASTDATNEIVEQFQEKDPRIKLIIQGERRGKAHAINLFLQHSKGEICVLESADTLPAEETIERLCKPFSDPSVGMTGGRVIPLNDKSKFMGFVVHLLWELHHRLQKFGELVAFRRIFSNIPENTAVDEAWIQAEVTQRGFKTQYVPDAVVYNKGPETISDFIKQRRRIYAGHLHLARAKGFKVPSLLPHSVLRTFISNFRFTGMEKIWVLGAIVLEGLARLLGLYDFFIRRKVPYVWDVAITTKLLLSDERDRC